MPIDSGFRRWLLRVLPLLLAALVAGCGGGGGDDETPPPNAGPCVDNVLEASLIIVAARDTLSAAPIPVLTLDRITVSGVPVDLATFLSNVSTNARVLGTAVECTVPCGLGVLQGAHVFAASAPGYGETMITVHGGYSTHTGGCPSTTTGGMRISILLAPQ